MPLNKVAKEYIQTVISKINCLRVGFDADGKYFEYNDPAACRKFKMGYVINDFYVNVFVDDTLIANIVDGRIYRYCNDNDDADLNDSVLAWFKLLEIHLLKN